MEEMTCKCLFATRRAICIASIPSRQCCQINKTSKMQTSLIMLNQSKASSVCSYTSPPKPSVPDKGRSDEDDRQRLNKEQSGQVSRSRHKSTQPTTTRSRMGCSCGCTPPHYQDTGERCQPPHYGRCKQQPVEKAGNQ